jgi:hypothetical protein
VVGEGDNGVREGGERQFLRGGGGGLEGGDGGLWRVEAQNGDGDGWPCGAGLLWALQRQRELGRGLGLRQRLSRGRQPAKAPE